MFTVIYDAVDGYIVADAKVKGFVEDMLLAHKNDPFFNRLRVGGESLINEFRLAVMQDKINHEELQFEFEGQILPVEADGRLKTWPTGFCDLIITQLSALCRGRKSND